MLLRAGLWLAAGVTLGRLAGFAREILIGRELGISGQADAATFLLTLPDAILNVLIGSAMAAALLPALARVRHQAGETVDAQPTPSPAVDRLFGQTLVALVGAVVVLEIVLGFAQPWLIGLLAPKFTPETVALVSPLVTVALLAMPLTMASAVLGVVLQERYRMAATSLGTLAFNGVVIVGLVSAPFVRIDLLPVIAWTLVGGAGLRLALQVLDWRLARGGFALAGPWLPDRALAVAYVQAMLAGAAPLLVPVVARAFANDHGEGAMAAFTYASKLFELPLAVLITVVSTAIMPRLVAHAAGSTADDRTAGTALLAKALQLVLITGLASAIALGVFAEDGARLVWSSKMSAEDLRGLGRLTGILAYALPAAGISSILIAWLNAGRDTRSPLIITTGAALLFLAAALILPGLHGLFGLAMAVVVLHLATLFPLLLLVRRRSGAALGPVARRTALIVAATLIGTLPGLVLAAGGGGSEYTLIRVGLGGLTLLGGCLGGFLAAPGLRQLR